MKYIFRLLVGFCALALIISCVSSEEAAGDKAYDMSKKATGEARRTQLKTAFMNYRKAVMADTANVSTKLRNRFIEMCVVRAHMVLEEGSASMDAIPLLMSDIESQLKDDVQPDLRQRYAAFLVQLGDSSAARDRYIDALRHYEKAIEKAADPSPFKDKRASVIRNVAEENYQIGMMEFELGKSEKDEEKFIRAEYFAKVALYFDSTYEKAQKLLSDVYKENVATYAAFVTAVTDYTDTVMFRSINKFDILLAVPDIKTRGRNTTAIVHMYSNTYNPLRMKSEHFTIETADGKKFTALPGQKMSPDILDQEREAQYTLNFPVISGRIKKLVYENGPHYSEKNFF